MKIGLHKTQMDFLASSAIYKAFVGGIASGKSWAGSYDMLRRAKAGRLYMVIAPTYTMLCDSTFRIFLALAQRLGIVDPQDVKHSAPPSIKLRTGAEILFRSADEPDRLRGPNLSGIWLDEASLMEKDVFAIAIGRLREAGEQGWLSATFTPKGKAHWTFETFAAGGPDVALFRARTQDNPFLPRDFASTVRRQYTSQRAAQELEGEFIDAAGCLFRREWFGIVDKPPAVIAACRAWDLAATPKDEAKANDPDWTAGVLVAKGRDGTLYVLDVRRLRGTPQEVQTLVCGTAQQDGRLKIVMEQEPGSAGVAVIDHYRRLLSQWHFVGRRSTGSKADRAMPLAANAEAGIVKLLRGNWNLAFLDEAEIFPFGPHDDQIDAASLALANLALLGSSEPDFGIEMFGGRNPAPRAIYRDENGRERYTGAFDPPDVDPACPVGFGHHPWREENQW